MAAKFERRHCFCCVDAKGLAHVRPIDRNGWKMRFWEEFGCRFRYYTALDPAQLARL